MFNSKKEHREHETHDSEKSTDILLLTAADKSGVVRII